MHHHDLERYIAQLEFVNDQLMTELATMDRMLKTIGFADGVTTMKKLIHEVIAEEEL